MWVGGTADIWSSKVKGADSELSFKVMPEFGYILNENLAVGIALGGSHNKVHYSFGDLSVSEGLNSYTVNPFLRYTFLKGELGSLFFDGGVAYNWSKVTNGGQKTSGLDVGLKPGVAVNVSNKISLIGKFGFLGYNYTKVGEGKEAVTRNQFGLNLDMRNVELGVNFKF